jgi:hypothetical protein
MGSIYILRKHQPVEPKVNYIEPKRYRYDILKLYLSFLRDCHDSSGGRPHFYDPLFYCAIWYVARYSMIDTRHCNHQAAIYLAKRNPKSWAYGGRIHCIF